MQDPLPSSSGPAILAAGQDPPLEQLKCPRCDSTNTKFCYYNNYNLSQPRHFCKNCRRYWTKGGSLRNIPVGGGSRKNSKRASASAANPNPPKRPTPDPVPASSLKPEPAPAAIYPLATDPDDKMLEISGSFSSLLQSSGQSGDLNFLDGFDLGAGSGEITNPAPDPQTPQREQPENFMAWAGGWPDLAIYTSPGSSFQ